MQKEFFMGTKEIVYYETTRTYGKILKGLRFKVVKDSSKAMNLCIKEGLSEATGIPPNQLDGCINNCGIKQI